MWLQDPMPELESLAETYDMIASRGKQCDRAAAVAAAAVAVASTRSGGPFQLVFLIFLFHPIRG
jgi:hypothetical protein